MFTEVIGKKGMMYEYEYATRQNKRLTDRSHGAYWFNWAYNIHFSQLGDNHVDSNLFINMLTIIWLSFVSEAEASTITNWYSLHALCPDNSMFFTEYLLEIFAFWGLINLLYEIYVFYAICTFAAKKRKCST